MSWVRHWEFSKNDEEFRRFAYFDRLDHLTAWFMDAWFMDGKLVEFVRFDPATATLHFKSRTSNDVFRWRLVLDKE